MTAVVTPVEVGKDTEWLLHELDDKITLIDRRPHHQGDGLLIAPFSTEREVADALNSIYPDWETRLEIIHPGAKRVEQLLR